MQARHRRPTCACAFSPLKRVPFRNVYSQRNRCRSALGPLYTCASFFTASLVSFSPPSKHKDEGNVPWLPTAGHPLSAIRHPVPAGRPACLSAATAVRRIVQLCERGTVSFRRDRHRAAGRCRSRGPGVGCLLPVQARCACRRIRDAGVSHLSCPSPPQSGVGGHSTMHPRHRWILQYLHSKIHQWGPE